MAGGARARWRATCWPVTDSAALYRTPDCPDGPCSVEEDSGAPDAAGAGPDHRGRGCLLRLSGPAGVAPVRGPPLDAAGTRVCLAAGAVCRPAADAGGHPA